MREYVEVTLNEQWQKECGVRWTVATTQTISVSNHHNHDHHNYHHRSSQRVQVHNWYNIEIRALNQTVPVQQVIVPMVVAPNQVNQAPPKYAAAGHVVQGNGIE